MKRFIFSSCALSLAMTLTAGGCASTTRAPQTPVVWSGKQDFSLGAGDKLGYEVFDKDTPASAQLDSN